MIRSTSSQPEISLLPLRGLSDCSSRGPGPQDLSLFGGVGAMSWGRCLHLGTEELVVQSRRVWVEWSWTPRWEAGLG